MPHLDAPLVLRRAAASGVALALVLTALAASSVGHPSTVEAGAPPPGKPILSLVGVPGSGSYAEPLLVTSDGTSDRLFVVERGGTIRVIDGGVKQSTPFLSMSGVSGAGFNDSGDEEGLLGLVFDPAFATNHTFYVSYTRTDGSLQVSSFTTATATADTAGTTATPIIDIPHPVNQNHNGGMLELRARRRTCTSAPATAARRTIRAPAAATPRTRRCSSARSCVSMCTAPRRCPARPTASPPTTRSRAARAGPRKSGPGACAIRGAGASTRRPATCGSPTSARTPTRRSTTSAGPAPARASTSAGRTTRASTSRTSTRARPRRVSRRRCWRTTTARAAPSSAATSTAAASSPISWAGTCSAICARARSGTWRPRRRARPRRRCCCRPA